MKTISKSIKRIVLTAFLVAAASVGGFESSAMACNGYQRTFSCSKSYGAVGVYIPRSYGSSNYYSSYGPRYRSWSGSQNYGYGGIHFGGYVRPHRGYSYGYSY
ncbi:MAG: hypothetical protein KDA68_05775 [Planctomycetaceae bacterium]|nr:hypothetical protein [Planctomycetaceae bacterium]